MSTSMTFGDLLLGHIVQPWALVALAITSGLVGMFSHWVKLVFKDKQTGLGMVQYFFVKNFRATLLAVGGTLAALFAAFAPLEIATITAYQVITQAFAIGYASDSVLNHANVSSEEDGK